MAIGDRVRASLARWVLKGASLPVVPDYVRQSFLEPTFQRLVKDGYQKNAAVFSCVSALCFAFPEPPIQVYDGEDDDAAVIPQHPLRMLLKNPNPLMGEAELMVITMAYMAIGGNAYWHKVRDRRGRVIEIWPYHAGHFSAVPGGDTWIRRYDFIDGGAQRTPVDPSEVVHFKWPSPDPNQPWQAQPPLMAAAHEVDTDSEATAYLFALLKNDAVPRTIITSGPERFMNDDEVRRTKEQFRERYSGNKRGDVAILEAGSKIDRLGLDLQQLAFEALHRIPETRIAASFRVPAIVAGLSAGLERSTYANYGQARTAFTRDTLGPLWRIVASEIGADLVPEVGGPLGDARFDLRRVSALKEDTDKQWGRITGAWRDDLLTKNEARAALGYTPRPGGDVTRSEAAAALSAVAAQQPTAITEAA
jgi:HK97 family phage portal protein